MMFLKWIKFYLVEPDDGSEHLIFFVHVEDLSQGHTQLDDDGSGRVPDGSYVALVAFHQMAQQSLLVVLFALHLLGDGRMSASSVPHCCQTISVELYEFFFLSVYLTRVLNYNGYLSTFLSLSVTDERKSYTRLLDHVKLELPAAKLNFSPGGSHAAYRSHVGHIFDFRAHFSKFKAKTKMQCPITALPCRHFRRGLKWLAARRRAPANWIVGDSAFAYRLHRWIFITWIRLRRHGTKCQSLVSFIKMRT